MNQKDDCYLIIESDNSEKTAGFYKTIGLEVTEGYPLGDYLVFTNFGYITINQTDGEKPSSTQAYKPIINLDLKREEMDSLVNDIKENGSKITEVGEFLNLAVYECEDFSGGVISLQIGIKP